MVWLTYWGYETLCFSSSRTSIKSFPKVFFPSHWPPLFFIPQKRWRSPFLFPISSISIWSWVERSFWSRTGFWENLRRRQVFMFWTSCLDMGSTVISDLYFFDFILQDMGLFSNRMISWISGFENLMDWKTASQVLQVFPFQVMVEGDMFPNQP